MKIYKLKYSKNMQNVKNANYFMREHFRIYSISETHSLKMIYFLKGPNFQNLKRQICTNLWNWRRWSITDKDLWSYALKIITGSVGLSQFLRLCDLKIFKNSNFAYNGPVSLYLHGFWENGEFMCLGSSDHIADIFVDPR